MIKQAWIGLCVLLGLCLFCNPVWAENRQTTNNFRIVINVAALSLELYDGDNIIKQYSVAVGSSYTQTPLGSYRVLYKEKNPAWYPPEGGVVPSGPYNPLGYRWINFFGNYGIHGTNAPGSIGSPVSHGCVRMQETDVEDLYERVPVGTPVQVVYERMRLHSDEQGYVNLVVYPDVYGRQNLTTAELRHQLMRMNWNGLADETVLQQVLANCNGQVTTLGRTTAIEVNNRRLNAYAFVQQGVLYIPVWPVCDALQHGVEFDREHSMVRKGNCFVSAVVHGDVIYVTQEQAQTLFGGVQEFNHEENIWRLHVISLLLNGQNTGIEVQQSEQGYFVPVLPVAKILKVNVTSDTDNRKLLYQQKSIPFVMMNGQPFMNIGDINAVFDGSVYLNRNAFTVDITWPIAVSSKR